MKKLRTFYDIFSILLVLAWTTYLILSSTLSVGTWMNSVWIMFIILAVVSVIYTISIIGLAMALHEINLSYFGTYFLRNKEKSKLILFKNSS
jgi:hypothetical protein